MRDLLGVPGIGALMMRKGFLSGGGGTLRNANQSVGRRIEGVERRVWGL